MLEILAEAGILIILLGMKPMIIRTLNHTDADGDHISASVLDNSRDGGGLKYIWVICVGTATGKYKANAGAEFACGNDIRSLNQEWRRIINKAIRRKQ